MAKIIQPDKLQGKYVKLREVAPDDAEFIFNLRRSEKAKYLNPTSSDIHMQKEYIKNYLAKENEWYFIVENKDAKPLGTLRVSNVKKERLVLGPIEIDDKNEKCFTLGSWIMIDGATIEETIEGEYLLKQYAFCTLNLEDNYFDVRKANKRVLQFHKMYGAVIIDEDEKNYYLRLTKKSFLDNSHKFLNIIY